MIPSILLYLCIQRSRLRDIFSVVPLDTSLTEVVKLSNGCRRSHESSTFFHCGCSLTLFHSCGDRSGDGGSWSGNGIGCNTVLCVFCLHGGMVEAAVTGSRRRRSASGVVGGLACARE